MPPRPRRPSTTSWRSQLVVRSEPLEVTALVAALGSLLLVAGGVLSLARTGRLP